MKEDQDINSVVKIPEVLCFKNNYNALVLSLKGWSPKEICLNKDIFLRKTDAHMDAKRTVGDRLTVPKYKGKPQYPNLVGTQRKVRCIIYSRFAMVLLELHLQETLKKCLSYDFSRVIEKETFS